MCSPLSDKWEEKDGNDYRAWWILSSEAKKAENLATDVPFYVLLFISNIVHNQRSDKVDVKVSSKETQEWPEQKRAVCQIAIFINFHQNVNGMD